MYHFVRTENGNATKVSGTEGLAELNRAQMSGKRDVAEMVSGRRSHAIKYKDGRVVTLTLVGGDIHDSEDKRVDGASAKDESDPAVWAVASHKTLLHRFTEASESGRAVCNRRFRPWKYANGHNFKSRADHAAGEHAGLYTFCPRCEAKFK